MILDLEIPNQIQFAIAVRVQQFLNLAAIHVNPPLANWWRATYGVACEHGTTETSRCRRESQPRPRSPGNSTPPIREVRSPRGTRGATLRLPARETAHRLS